MIQIPGKPSRGSNFEQTIFEGSVQITFNCLKSLFFESKLVSEIYFKNLFSRKKLARPYNNGIKQWESQFSHNNKIILTFE